jgi:prepilin-type N-terminal cleavage/methylation domain-containing protein
VKASHEYIFAILTPSHDILWTITMKRGFTLIELLVVIAIIGLLSSVVLATLSTARAKGRFARTIADMHQVQIAAETFNANTGDYPEDAMNGQLPPNATTDFLSAWPAAPCPGWTYDYDYWRPTDYSVVAPPDQKMARIVFLNAGVPKFYYCFKSAGGICKHPIDESDPNFIDIRDKATKEITCME